MNKNCIDSKNYALTQGQPYEILTTEGNYVYVINDKGKTAKYHNSLFEETPPPPPARTENDCIDSISYVNNVLAYRDIDNNLRTTTVVLHCNSNNSFSCGIVRFEGLNNLCSLIENQLFVNTTTNDFIPLKKALFETVLRYWISYNSTHKGMWMCSTNQDDSFEDYHSLLDTISSHNSGWFRNHNSGNQIKLWYGIIAGN